MPETVEPTRIGKILIEIMLDSEGEAAVTYSYHDMSLDTAIGYMTTVQDRMRDVKRFDWATPPYGAYSPWEDEDDEEFDDEDDEDLDGLSD